MLSKTSLCYAIVTHGVAMMGGGGIYGIYTYSSNHSKNPVELVNDAVKCTNPAKDVGDIKMMGNIEYHYCDSIQTTLPQLDGINHDLSHSSTEFEMNRTFRSNTVAYKDTNKLTKGTITPQTPTKEEESFYYSGNYGKNNFYFLKPTIHNNPNIESLKKRISNFLLERLLENTLTFHHSDNPPNTPMDQECHIYGVIQHLSNIKYGICDRKTEPHHKPPTNIRTFQPSDNKQTTFSYGGNSHIETKDAFTWENLDHTIHNVFENTFSNVYLYNAGSLREHEQKQLIRGATIYLMNMYPQTTQTFDMMWEQGLNTSITIDLKEYIFTTYIRHSPGIDFERQITDCKIEYCAIGVKAKPDLTVGYNQHSEIIFVTQTGGNTYIYTQHLTQPTTEEKKALVNKIDAFLESLKTSESVQTGGIEEETTQPKHNYSFLDMTYIHFYPTIPLDQCKKQNKKYCEGKLMVTSEGYRSGSNTNGKVLFYKNENDNSVVINLSGGAPEDQNQQFMAETDAFIKQDT